MASHDVKSTHYVHNCNEHFSLSYSGVERGEQSLALPSVSGLQSCQLTGQVALFGLNPTSDFPSWVVFLFFFLFFIWLFFGRVFSLWLQVPVGSLGCLVQGSAGIQGLLASGCRGLCSGLEGAFRGAVCWEGFQCSDVLFSYSAGLWGVHLCKVLLLCVHIAR